MSPYCAIDSTPSALRARPPAWGIVQRLCRVLFLCFPLMPQIFTDFFLSTDLTDDTDFMHRSRLHGHPVESARRSRQLRAQLCSLCVLCDSACEKHVSVKLVSFVGDKEYRVLGIYISRDG